jgi:hypothetical protein
MSVLDDIFKGLRAFNELAPEASRLILLFRQDDGTTIEVDPLNQSSAQAITNLKQIEAEFEKAKKEKEDQL